VPARSDEEHRRIFPGEQHSHVDNEIESIRPKPQKVERVLHRDGVLLNRRTVELDDRYAGRR